MNGPASVPPCLRGEFSSVEECPFEPNVTTNQEPTTRNDLDPNSELSLIHDRHAPSSNPRTVGAVPLSPVADELLPVPEPLPIASYVNAERLEFHNAKRFPHRSEEHDRRAELGPEWHLMPCGFESGSRVIFVGYRNGEERPSKGDAGRYFVDLDRMEFCPWGGQWEAFTTEARRHGEEEHDCISDSDFRRCDVANDANAVQVQKAGVELAGVCSLSVASVSRSSAVGAEHRQGPSEEPRTMNGLPSVPPCLRGESFGWRDKLPAYEPNQIGWKLIGSRIVRTFQATPEEHLC